MITEIDSWTKSMEKTQLKRLENNDLRLMMKVYFFTPLTVIFVAGAIMILAMTIYTSYYDPMALLLFTVFIFFGIKSNSKRVKVCEEADNNYKQLTKVRNNESR